MRLRHQVHRLALLTEPRHDLARKVRLPGARQAGEQQGPPRPLRLHARRCAAPQQWLTLFHPKDGCAVLVPQPGQRLQALLPALWQPLEQ